MASNIRASRRQRLAIVLGLIVVCVAAAALARPGSGQSYSGNSHSSSGSGSSGGGGGSGNSGEGLAVLIQLLFWLLFEHPLVGLPLVVIAAVVVLRNAKLRATMKEWGTGMADGLAQPTAPAAGPDRTGLVRRAELDRIRTIDPAFSVVLFEDFVYMLYAALQRARATGMAPIAAYVAPEVAQSLQDPSLADVNGIIIGAMRTLRFSGTGGTTIELEVEVEANFVQRAQGGAESRFYVVDRLVLERAATARSRSPERSRKLDCPNCGAPLEALRGAECTYCHENVGFGRFDWVIRQFSNRTCEPRGPLLTSDVAEVGTNLPTIIDPGADSRFAELRQRSQGMSFQTVQSRIAYVFNQLQGAWSGRDPKQIRPFVTDNLFQSMVYWIDLYVQQRCRNVTDKTQILKIELVNALSDATFDAITVRLYATGLDYTIADDGKVLSGSRSKPRQYSEYWTLIRARGSLKAAGADNLCPNCNAPMNVGMTGNCEYCHAKVTSGQFDWVLSRIEQDESYSG
jgi:hypothetical protein